jgi:FkbM family methyltransferase
VNLKAFARRLSNACGYQITRSPKHRHGLNPYYDMVRFLGRDRSIVVLDVGANVGLTVKNFHRDFPNSTIHAFEPSPRTYRELTNNTAKLEAVQTWNFGLGSQAARLKLLENSRSGRSSILETGVDGWGTVQAQTEVEIRTLDDFCAEHGIEKVDILKVDTEGYDLEVLKGAQRLLNENRIGMVYCEIFFMEIYRGMPPFDEMYRYLIDRRFALVNFYHTLFDTYRVAVGCTGLFVNTQIHSIKTS